MAVEMQSMETKRKNMDKKGEMGKETADLLSEITQ